MEATEAATRFRNAVASLRENMEALVQAQGDERRLSDLLAEFPLLLLDLKASSRATHLGVDHYRQLVRDYKKTLDAHHLQLQNLLYRKHHLLREMMLCHDFKIPEVHLVEKNEHISIVGDGSDLASVEQHQARLKLLTDEMQARKRLEQTLQVCSGDLSVISLKLRAESNLRPPPQLTSGALGPLSFGYAIEPACPRRTSFKEGRAKLAATNGGWAHGSLWTL